MWLKDQHAIIRSWAIKDYAPKCAQYVTIFRPENKMHVKHAGTITKLKNLLRGKNEP